MHRFVFLTKLTAIFLTVVTLTGCAAQLTEAKFRDVFLDVIPPDWNIWLQQTVGMAPSGYPIYLEDEGVNGKAYDAMGNRHDVVLNSSKTQEIILVHREEEIIEYLDYGVVSLPVYRYHIKTIDDDDFLAKHKGKYLYSQDKSGRFTVALLPEKKNAKNGILTEWHLCIKCVAGYQKDIEQFTVKDYANVTDKYPELLAGYKRFYLKSKAEVVAKHGPLSIQFGEAALTARSKYVKRFWTLDYYKSRAGLREYNRFVTFEYLPATIEGHMKKNGCPSKTGGIWDNARVAENAIEINERVISCLSKTLDNYDLSTYSEIYPSLVEKETKLREEAELEKHDDAERVTIVTPDHMYKKALALLEKASNEIEVNAAHIDEYFLEQDQKAQRQRLKDMINQQIQTSIAQQHQQTLNQALVDNQRMVDRAWTQRQREMDEVNRQVQQLQDQQRAAKRKVADAERHTQKQQAPEAPDTGEVQAGSYTPDTTTSQSQTDNKDSQAEEKPNQMVGSGRDYEMYGSTEVYHPYDTAVDLAKTNLRNKAAEFCSSSYKADITWGETNCKKSEHADTYQCSVGGLINCWEQRCDSEFCGTRN